MHLHIAALGKTRTSVSVYFYIWVQSLLVKLVQMWVRVFCTGLACDILANGRHYQKTN